jgi:hypothetical protein
MARHGRHFGLGKPPESAGKEEDGAFGLWFGIEGKLVIIETDVIWNSISKSTI